jgi:hypothetical protein
LGSTAVIIIAGAAVVTAAGKYIGLAAVMIITDGDAANDIAATLELLDRSFWD